MKDFSNFLFSERLKMKIEVNRDITTKQECSSFGVVFSVVFFCFSIWFFNVWGHDFKRVFIEGRAFERFEIVNIRGNKLKIKYEDGSTEKIIL